MAHGLADAEWARVERLVEEAEEIAAGRRGHYPYSEREREALAERFEAARRDVAALVAARRLEPEEGELFLRWLEVLRGRTFRFRTTELRLATCYAPVRQPDRAELAAKAAERLAARIPLVQALLERGALHREVMAKVVEQLEEDRKALAAGPSLTAEQQRTLDEVRAAIRGIKKKM